MRNLKRALSAALASVMVLGLMVVGASAASYEDFTDKAEITHKEAVSMVTELGIIAGLTDGSYGPAQNIDRASFARLVCVTLNAGKEPKLGDLKTTFSDTQGNWAEKYIAYCVDRSIIAGKGNNTFAPSANVTGSEAAKMLLVALGYNPVYEGIGGSTWQITTDVLANQAGLYDDLEDMNTSAPLTRDQAAQMIYNTLNADVVSYSWTLNANGSTIAVQNKSTKTLLEDKFDAVKVEGIVIANEYGSVDTGEDAMGARGEDKTYIEVTDSDEKVLSGDFEVATGLDMLGKSVVLYAKVGSTSAASKATVLGNVIISEDNVIASTSGSKKPADLADDNGLDLVKGTKYFVNYDEVESVEALKLKSDGKTLKGSTLTLIDNDDDGDVDYVLQLVKTFGEVTAYSAKSDGNITVTISSADNTGYKEKYTNFSSSDAYDDVYGFEDVEKEDKVFVWKIGDDMYVEKAEVVTGTVESVKGEKATVDGVTYEMSGLVTNVEDKASGKNVADALDDSLDDEVKLYLDAAGNVAMVDDVDDVDDYLVVTAISNNKSDFDETVKCKVVLADGTKATVEVNIDDEDYVREVKEYTLYTYSTDSDGTYNLEEVENSGRITLKNNELAKGRVTIAQTKSGDDTLTLKADKDTVFVVGKNDGDTYKVYTGIANVPNMEVDASTTVLADVQSGTAEFVFVADSKISGDDEEYIYVIDAGTKTKDENGDDAYSWDVILDGEVITVTGDEDIYKTMKKECLYSVELNGDEITSIDKTSKVALQYASVCEDGIIELVDETSKKVTATFSYNDDTLFIAVDDTDLSEASDGYIVTTNDTTKEGDWSEVIVVPDEDNADLAAYVYIIE